MKTFLIFIWLVFITCGFSVLLYAGINFPVQESNISSCEALKNRPMNEIPARCIKYFYPGDKR